MREELYLKKTFKKKRLKRKTWIEKLELIEERRLCEREEF